jgi:heme exporter protein D
MLYRSCRRIATTVGLVLLALRLIALYVVPSWRTIDTDFPNYYVAAWAVRHGESLTELYNPVWFDWEKRRAGIERPAALFNYFPPLNALILWPLADLAPITAKRAWTVVNVVALLAVIHLTRKASGLTWPASALLALLGGDALGNNFTYGQFYIVLTLLMMCGILVAERHPAVAGIASAAGAMTKIFPGFLLLYFAMRRRYRALAWCGAAAAALALIGYIAMGWAPHRTYLAEVLARSLRGEIQDPYNIHWNTLQALLRRALVRDELLNPSPVFDLPWLYFFLRPLISLAIVAATFHAIFRAERRKVLLEYGALIAMVSLITPSQASYHQVLFYPAVAALIAIERSRPWKLILAVLFGLICSNIMGAAAGYGDGVLMPLAFPRVWIVIFLWALLLRALDPPPLRVSRPVVAWASAAIVLATVASVIENRRWIADVADGATLAPLPTRADLEVQPRFVDGRLVTSVLNADGLTNPAGLNDGPSTSPDGHWTVFSTNVRGNWDVAIRSNQTGEVRYLTSSSANDLTPSFSPDGSWVYFASDRHRGYRFTAIYRVRLHDR